MRLYPRGQRTEQGSQVAVSCVLFRLNVSRGGQTLETTDNPEVDVLIYCMKFSKNK